MNVDLIDSKLEQDNSKIKVFAMFDGHCKTWNVMTADRQCLFFGTADGADNWLLENNDRYLECSEREVMEQNDNKMVVNI